MLDPVRLRELEEAKDAASQKLHRLELKWRYGKDAGMDPAKIPTNDEMLAACEAVKAARAALETYRKSGDRS